MRGDYDKILSLKKGSELRGSEDYEKGLKEEEGEGLSDSGQMLVWQTSSCQTPTRLVDKKFHFSPCSR